LNSTLFYTTLLGPPVGVPAAMYAPPLRYKREALAVQNKLMRSHTRARPSSLELSRGKAIQHIVDVGYYAPAARTTLNLDVFIVFLSEIELGLANPRVHTLSARAGAFRHPAVVCSTTTFGAPGRGGLAGRSSSLLRLHGSCGRRRDGGGCGVLHAT